MAKQIILAVCCLAFAACGDDHVDEYTMIKASAAPVADEHAGHDHAPGEGHATVTATSVPASGLQDPRSIVWTAPETWKSSGASGMRLASYQLPDAGDLSVISLGGDGGGLLANINRWRNQVGLDPIEESQLASQTKTLESSIGVFVGVTLINPDQADNAICGAVFTGSDFTLYVKLSGNKACIEKHAAAVFTFCTQAKTL